MAAKDQDGGQVLVTRMDGLAYLGPKSPNAPSAPSVLQLVSAERVQWVHLCVRDPPKGALHSALHRSKMAAPASTLYRVWE
jgi:hypothetical protein